VLLAGLLALMLLLGDLLAMAGVLGLDSGNEMALVRPLHLLLLVLLPLMVLVLVLVLVLLLLLLLLQVANDVEPPCVAVPILAGKTVLAGLAVSVAPVAALRAVPLGSLIRANDRLISSSPARTLLLMRWVALAPRFSFGHRPLFVVGGTADVPAVEHVVAVESALAVAMEPVLAVEPAGAVEPVLAVGVERFVHPADYSADPGVAVR
jgi:hypothetical protein